MNWKEYIFNGSTYWISDTGLVEGRISRITQRLDDDGYPCVSIGYTKRSRIRVHRLVAKLFVDNPNNELEVNHIDGNKQNNCYTNLEWCNRSHQLKHAYKLNLKSVEGIKNPRHILLEEDVIKIRELYFQNKFSVYYIAKLYGRGWTTINHVIKNETWKNVK